MTTMELAVSLITLLTVQLTMADIPGICTVTTMVLKNRYVMDREKNDWIHEKYNVPVEKVQCCEGYRTISLQPLQCSPICDPPCKNSECMGPNICVCHPGHVMSNNSSSTCYEICDSCVNGACHGNDIECSCNKGYQRDQNFTHICNPICSNSCVNATCFAPDSCQCFDGFEKHPYKSPDHVCIPKCREPCIFGTCTEPNICTCLEGYINDNVSPNICLPVCNHNCENGECYAPDTCKCRDGFELHTNNPYRCVPSLKICKLTMPKAIKYDKHSSCFIIKDKLVLSVSPQCRGLNSPGIRSETFCSHPSKCHDNECILNFLCSIKRFNGLNEIHCNLEAYDHEGLFININKTQSYEISFITNTTDWSDIVLMVNLNLSFNSSIEIKESRAKEWTLSPQSITPVCGEMLFAMDMSDCGLSSAGKESNHTDSSLMFWINVFLVSGFLLLVSAGVGGFLWARHHKRNDPLNYREDMMRGCYNNQCYGNEPAELVSDDDSDRESDSPL